MSPNANIPELHTARLILRAFRLEDAAAVQRLAGDRAIADTTISVPHPYRLDQAQAWIARLATDWEEGRSVGFAITLSPAVVVGAIGLRDLDAEHAQAEVGFWIGREHWGLGYATEAGQAVLRFAFETLGLNRVHAHHMVRNPASGRVLEKLGLRREGLLRQRVRKWGVYEDVILCAILRSDYEVFAETWHVPR